jgi:hypothetical protein
VPRRSNPIRLGQPCTAHLPEIAGATTHRGPEDAVARDSSANIPPATVESALWTPKGEALYGNRRPIPANLKRTR